MSAAEEATRLHESGYNCAQSVLGGCEAYTGLDAKTARAISAGFGGGVRCDEICGAVCGGVMALGLCFPFTDAKDTAAKDRIAALAKTFTAAFREQFGALRCQELKGDKKNCPAYIAFAAWTAESMISKSGE